MFTELCEIPTWSDSHWAPRCMQIADTMHGANSPCKRWERNSMQMHTGICKHRYTECAPRAIQQWPMPTVPGIGITSKRGCRHPAFVFLANTESNNHSPTAARSQPLVCQAYLVMHVLLTTASSIHSLFHVLLFVCKTPMTWHLVSRQLAEHVLIECSIVQDP